MLCCKFCSLKFQVGQDSANKVIIMLLFQRIICQISYNDINTKYQYECQLATLLYQLIINTKPFDMAQQQDQKQAAKNIFPLHALKLSEHSQIMVQLKSGETYNGTLIGIDKFMNIKLADAVLTNPTGDLFRQVPDVYVRGNVVKYFMIGPQVFKKLEGTQYKAPEKFGKGQYRGKDRDKHKQFRDRDRDRDSSKNNRSQNRDKHKDKDKGKQKQKDQTKIQKKP